MLIASSSNPGLFRPATARRPRRLLRASVFVGALLPAVGGCARKELKSEMDRARSWTATTRLAVDRSSAGAINDAVTAQLAQRAVKAHSQAERRLAELAKTDSQRAAARGVLDSLGEGILHLEQAGR